MSCIKNCQHCIHAVSLSYNPSVFTCLRHNIMIEKNIYYFGWHKSCKDFEFNKEGFKGIKY